MKQLRVLSVLFILLTVIISCNNKEEKTKESKVSYPQNEIPVNTSNQEALTSFMEGMQHYEMGDYRKARDFFDAALTLDPNFVSAQIYRAYTNSSAKDWATQRDHVMALRDKANKGEALLINAMESNMNGDREAEGEYYHALADMFPESAQAQDFLAGYYYGSDNVSKRRSYWEKAISLNSSYLPGLMGLGMSYASTDPKDFSKAEKYLKKAIEIAPENSSAYISLGDGYRYQNNLKDALENYITATQLNPYDDVAHTKAGHANNMLGNYEDARKYYTQAQEVSEFGLSGKAYFIYTYLYEGNHTKAMDLLMESIDAIDAMNIPPSNKNVAKYSATLDAAQVAMHYNDAEKLQSLVESMKPYSKQIVADVSSSAVVANQNSFMMHWEGLAALAANNFEEADKKAEDSKTALASINDENKLQQYHFLKGMISYHKEDYVKAKDHFLQGNTDYVYDIYWLAKTYEKLGDKEESAKFYEKAKAENFNSMGNALVKNELMTL